MQLLHTFSSAQLKVTSLNGQTEDLARMFRLFNRIPSGLEPVASMFKSHVEGEGLKLVKDVTFAVEERKGKDAGGSGSTSEVNNIDKKKGICLLCLGLCLVVAACRACIC